MREINPSANPADRLALQRERRLALVDVMRGQEPISVLGLLIQKAKPVTKEFIAGYLGMQLAQVDYLTDLLIDDDLCVPVVENEVDKIQAFASYTTKND